MEISRLDSGERYLIDVFQKEGGWQATIDWITAGEPPVDRLHRVVPIPGVFKTEQEARAAGHAFAREQRPAS